MLLKEGQPIWKTLAPEIFPEGSFGRDIFPAALDGRNRPLAPFEQPIGKLWSGRPAVGPQELRRVGLQTVKEALDAPSSVLSSLIKASQIKEHFEDFLGKMVVTPHARLLQAIFGPMVDIQASVPAEIEPDLIAAVNEAVAGLTGRHPKILSLRYGLADGINRTLEEVGTVLNLTSSSVHRDEHIALRSLSHRSRVKSSRIEGYLTVPPHSLAVQEFGIYFQRDLPRFPRLDWENLNPLTQEVLFRNRDRGADLFGIFTGEAELNNPLTDQERSAVVADIKSAIIEREEAMRAEEAMMAAEWVRARERAREAEVKNRVSQQIQSVETPLMAGRSINADVYGEIEEVTLNRTKFKLHYNTQKALQSAGVNTYRELLKLTPEELVRIVRRKDQVAQIGKELQDRCNDRSAENLSNALVQVLENKRAERRKTAEDMRIQGVRQAVQPLIEEGLIDPREIQRRLASQKGVKAVFGVSLSSWVALSMIEFILNHPAKTNK